LRAILCVGRASDYLSDASTALDQIGDIAALDDCLGSVATVLTRVAITLRRTATIDSI
jgi:hypothetical protein